MLNLIINYQEETNNSNFDLWIKIYLFDSVLLFQITYHVTFCAQKVKYKHHVGICDVALFQFSFYLQTNKGHFRNRSILLHQ